MQSSPQAEGRELGAKQHLGISIYVSQRELRTAVKGAIEEVGARCTGCPDLGLLRVGSEARLAAPRRPRDPEQRLTEERLAPFPGSPPPLSSRTLAVGRGGPDLAVHRHPRPRGKEMAAAWQESSGDSALCFKYPQPARSPESVMKSA